MKGIMFTEAMFKAVISGDKTQTRRICKTQPKHNVYQHAGLFWDGEIAIKPRYKVWEKLYLKEPYYIDNDGFTYYKYNPHVIMDYEPKKWYNKLFMPAKYARYFIQIEGVRCERLQDISYKDCFKEGIKSRVTAVPPYELIYQIPNNPNYYYTSQQAYADLIDSINGKGTWQSNPYVFVYDFILSKS